VTLDNLRVPIITSGKFKILSFRSKDPVFKPDPGVIPDDEVSAKAGIEVVRTGFQHNELSDRGPDSVKASIQARVQSFLDEDDGPSLIPLLSLPAPDLMAASVPAESRKEGVKP
jgi:hypothetical protein